MKKYHRYLGQNPPSHSPLSADSNGTTVSTFGCTTTRIKTVQVLLAPGFSFSQLSRLTCNLVSDSNGVGPFFRMGPARV